MQRPAAAINRAVDRGLIEAARVLRLGVPDGGGVLHKLGPAELCYLVIEGELEHDLTPAAQRRVYEALRGLPGGRGYWASTTATGTTGRWPRRGACANW